VVVWDELYGDLTDAVVVGCISRRT
jgi:hypothetical protein